MTEAAAAAKFELAARWREKFEHLEWLLAATSRARSAVDLLTFVYRDPGDFGDDRAYVVRQGTFRASYPYPGTPIEHEAFRAVVREIAADPAEPPGPLPIELVDEVLLVMSWFRQHPDALRRTTPYDHWLHNLDSTSASTYLPRRDGPPLHTRGRYLRLCRRPARRAHRARRRHRDRADAHAGLSAWTSATRSAPRSSR